MEPSQVPAASFGLFEVLAVFFGLIFFFFSCKTCPSSSCFSDVNGFSEHHSQTNLQVLAEGQFANTVFCCCYFLQNKRLVLSSENAIA